MRACARPMARRTRSVTRCPADLTEPFLDAIDRLLRELCNRSGDEPPRAGAIGRVVGEPLDPATPPRASGLDDGRTPNREDHDERGDGGRDQPSPSERSHDDPAVDRVADAGIPPPVCTRVRTVPRVGEGCEGCRPRSRRPRRGRGTLAPAVMSSRPDDRRDDPDAAAHAGPNQPAATTSSSSRIPWRDDPALPRGPERRRSCSPRAFVGQNDQLGRTERLQEERGGSRRVVEDRQGPARARPRQRSRACASSSLRPSRFGGPVHRPRTREPGSLPCPGPPT